MMNWMEREKGPRMFGEYLIGMREVYWSITHWYGNSSWLIISTSSCSRFSLFANDFPLLFWNRITSLSRF